MSDDRSQSTEIAKRWEPYFLWGFYDESIFMIDADGGEVCIQEHPGLLKEIQRVCREWDEKRRKVVQE